MQYPSYPFQQSEDATQFFFESIGPKGVIQKAVVFTLLYEPNIYNLALGDINSITGDIDDQIVTDNSDTPTVLATIYRVSLYYLTINPTHRLYVEGNTPTRNRLYRMAISHAWEELSTHFVMFGLCQGSWERFSFNRPYESFLLLKR